MQTKGNDAGSGGLMQRMAVIKFVWRVRQTSQHVVTYVFLLILLKIFKLFNKYITGVETNLPIRTGARESQQTETTLEWPLQRSLFFEF